MPGHLYPLAIYKRQRYNAAHAHPQSCTHSFVDNHLLSVWAIVDPTNSQSRSDFPLDCPTATLTQRYWTSAFAIPIRPHPGCQSVSTVPPFCLSYECPASIGANPAAPPARSFAGPCHLHGHLAAIMSADRA
jgi:hypothetical protein